MAPAPLAEDRRQGLPTVRPTVRPSVRRGARPSAAGQLHVGRAADGYLARRTSLCAPLNGYKLILYTRRLLSFHKNNQRPDSGFT